MPATESLTNGLGGGGGSQEAWKHMPSVVTWYPHSKALDLGELNAADSKENGTAKRAEHEDAAGATAEKSLAESANQKKSSTVDSRDAEEQQVEQDTGAKEMKKMQAKPISSKSEASQKPSTANKRGRDFLAEEKSAQENTPRGSKRERKQTQFLGAEDQVDTPSANKSVSQVSAKRKRGEDEKGSDEEDGGQDKKCKLEDPAAEKGVGREALKRKKGEMQKYAEDPVTGQIVLTTVLQMRGSSNPYYVGCPVEFKLKSKWAKGSVAALPDCSTDRIMVDVVATTTGKEVSVNADDLKDDVDAVGKCEVGRHIQVLFDGEMWYVGLIAAIDGLDKKRQTGTVRVLFEDGEDCEVALPDKDARLLPKEWSVQLGKLGRWGWWGYNSDRVARLKEYLGAKQRNGEAKGAGKRGKKGKKDAAAEAAGTSAESKAKTAKDQRPSHVRPMSEFMDREAAHVQAEEENDEEEEEEEAPVTPGRSGRERKQLDYSKMAAGPKIERRPSGEKKDGRKEISAAALALSLCDSLHEAAFSDWENSARSKWKAQIAKAASKLPVFAAQLKAFEGKLAQSAMTAGWKQARETMTWELGKLKSEEQAKNCVSLLAGHVQGILYKSEQQRALCCGPFLRR